MTAWSQMQLIGMDFAIAGPPPKFWFHVDDVVALLIVTPILFSFLQHFYLPPKREPGYDLFFTVPQSIDGIVRAKASNRSQKPRDIAQVLASSVSGFSLASLSNS